MLKLTSVKLLDNLYKKFKISNLDDNFTLQKLINRSMDLYVHDDNFRKQINEWQKDNLRIKAGKKVSEGFVYSSDNNKEWMTKNDLQKWIDLNQNHIGNI